MDSNVKEFASMIYKISNGEWDNCAYYLPSGAIFCAYRTNEDAEEVAETAIVTDVAVFNEPGTRAFWFYDMSQIGGVEKELTESQSQEYANDIFQLDKSYSFASDKNNIIEYIENMIESKKEYNEEYINDYTEEFEKGYRVTYDETIECAKQNFNEFLQSLNKNWKTKGVGCFMEALNEIYENHLSTPAKKYNLTEAEETVFENACDCLFYGYGFKYLKYKPLDEQRAKEIWKLAFEYMGN